MSRSATELTTTSYAMLGMLAIRPWSTYELAQHMDRGLGRLWPRARSNLFNEPKKLVAHGSPPRRTRPWGADHARSTPSLRPGGAPSGNGSAHLARVRSWSSSNCSKSSSRIRAPRPTRSPPCATSAPGRTSGMPRTSQLPVHTLRAPARSPNARPCSGVVGGFMTDFADMVGNWAEWATNIIDDWPDDPRDAEPAWDYFEEIARRGRPDRESRRP